MHDDPMSATQPVARRRAASELAASASHPYLQVLSGQQAGLVVRLGPYGMTLGRGADCTLVLDEAGISRNHARIVREGDEYWLEDLGSTNGTYVQDQEIQRHALKDGDRLELGESTALKFGRNSLSELELAEKLYDCATRDSLTRALNRGSFLERLQQELAYCKRHARPLCLALLDVDFFKKVNDTYGHPAGDFVLRFLAEQLRRQTRLEDVLGRYGGEEFGLLLRQTQLEAGLEKCEGLRAGIEACRPTYTTESCSQGTLIPFTVSFGLASLRADDTSESFLARADAALYAAKHSGRNCVRSEQS
ncbi:MAG: GGDEF domain-containing protein [Vulcanimicrobiota bacterium]